MITLDTRVQPDNDVVDTELEGGEMVLLHLQTKHYYSLNVTGIRIWQALKRGSSLQEISHRLQSEFAVDAEEAGASILTLVNELISQQLVRVV